MYEFHIYPKIYYVPSKIISSCWLDMKKNYAKKKDYPNIIIIFPNTRNLLGRAESRSTKTFASDFDACGVVCTIRRAIDLSYKVKRN